MSLSLIWAFPLAAHPAASPATLMVFSHINQLIKSKFQWWINLPELMRWSASCYYQSTCCQVIVSCWDVWHYEVHLEAQLSYNGSDCSKSIFGIGRIVRDLCFPGEAQFIPPSVSYARVVSVKSRAIFAINPLGCVVQVPQAFLEVMVEWMVVCLKRHFCTHKYIFMVAIERNYSGWKQPGIAWWLPLLHGS